MKLTDEQLAEVCRQAIIGVGASADDTAAMAIELAQARRKIGHWEDAGIRVCELFERRNDNDGSTESRMDTGMRAAEIIEETTRLLIGETVTDTDTGTKT